MNTLIGIALMFSVLLINGVVRADWGYGLNQQFKQSTIPDSQQSGWSTIDQATSLYTVRYRTGSDELTPASCHSLDQAAAVLKTNESVVVEIQGHADSVGSEPINQDLSERRAMAVRNYLIAKGVPTERLQTRGYGEMSPAADNSSYQGRAKNRRMQFVVIND